MNKVERCYWRILILKDARGIHGKKELWIFIQNFKNLRNYSGFPLTDCGNDRHKFFQIGLT
jgi:hypothetical protein